MNKSPLRTQGETKTNLTPTSGIMQRKCACGNHTMAGFECESCGKKNLSLQRKTQDSALRTQHPEVVPPIVYEVLRSPGQPLDPGTLAFFQPRFGHDFSHVRMHTDARAAESAKAVDALAYTVGHNIVFGANQSPQESPSRERVLAHELAHVVQQEGESSAGSLWIAPHNDPAEAAADIAAHRVLSHQQPLNLRGAKQHLQRLGANPGCTRAQAADIHQAIFNANSWVGKALTALAASPLGVRTLTALRHNFAASGTAANAGAIAATLRAGRADMLRNPYSCADATDATCSAAPCGYSTAAGVHASVICTNATLATPDAVYRAGCVLHEAIHASDASMTADDYSGWFGHSGSTAGYPGASPLANADSYTTLAMELS